MHFYVLFIPIQPTDYAVLMEKQNKEFFSVCKIGRDIPWER